MNTDSKLHILHLNYNKRKSVQRRRFASITILNSFVMRLFFVTYSQTSCKRLPEKSSLDFHILESLHIVTGPFRQRSAIPALEYFSLKPFIM